MNHPHMIHQLSEEIIGKISAGEVIASPYSVVKEMIENSLDANSTRITIKTTGNGENIEIIDDGKGISRDDLTLLCERHCTSKITKLEDLSALKSFGFRGEALFSISNCSKLTVKSLFGSEAYEGKYLEGKLIEIRKVGMNSGTHFTVTELFYNNSIRRKYLEQNSSERRKIDDLIKMYAVSNQNVVFNYDIGGSSQVTHLISPGKDPMSNKTEMLSNIFNFSCKLRSASGISKGGEEYHLIYSQPTLHLSKYTFVVFVNQRLVENRIIKRELLKVYSPILPKNKFPFLYLELTVPPAQIDVNVHPAKKEVLFEIDSLVSEIKKDLSSKLVSDEIHSIPCVTQPKADSQKSKIKIYSTPNISSLKEIERPLGVERSEKPIIKFLHEELTEYEPRFFKNLSLVGIMDNVIFLQQDQVLLRCNYTHLLQHLCYQILLEEFDHLAIFDTRIKANEPLNDDLLRIFHIETDGGDILQVPSVLSIKLLDKQCLAVADLISKSQLTADQVFQWAESREPEVLKEFQNILRALSDVFGLSETSNIFETIKRRIICTKQVRDLFSTVTTLSELYKQFERC